MPLIDADGSAASGMRTVTSSPPGTIPQSFAEWYGLQRLDDSDYRFVPDGTDRTRGHIQFGR